METPYSALFASTKLAGKTLRNRVFHASMSTYLAREQEVTDSLVQYHVTRARGGAAMIVTEPLGCAPHQLQPSRVRVWDRSQLGGLARWAESVESAGCRLLAQIQDAGRGRHLPGRNPSAIGASPRPDGISWTIPRALTIGEIERLIESFASSAAILKRCGFSGVELSAGHGHLFHQFMLQSSNVRTDAYGGTFENRLRLISELIAAIRAHCGRDFILGVKLPGDDGEPGGIRIDEAIQIGRHLAATGGVDYFCLAQGSHHRSLEMHIPDDHEPRLPYMPLTRAFRAGVPGIPVAALGRFTDPAEADGVLERGEADLVAIGRALVTDPAWPRKAMAGRARDIRYCVAGNACWHRVINHLPIACDNNPLVAQPEELDDVPARAQSPRRIVVVGSGVAGLEAAWVAAARGHEVTVLGRSAEVGGKTRLQALLPGSESVSSVYDFQQAMAVQLGVRVELGVDADVEKILALRPQAVVLATGSRMLWPDCLPVHLRDEGLVPDLRAALPDLLRAKGRQPGTAVLFDMDHTEGTYAAVELLCQRFTRVVLVTSRESIAQDVPLVSRQSIYRRFHRLPVELRLLSELYLGDRFENEGVVETVNVYGGEPVAIEDVAFIAYSTPREPNDELLEPLRAVGLAVTMAGDCIRPGPLMAATAQGNQVGRSV